MKQVTKGIFAGPVAACWQSWENTVRAVLYVVGLGLTLALGGCSASGPSAFSISSDEIEKEAVATPDGAQASGYLLFTIDAHVADLAGHYLPVSFGDTFGLGHAAAEQRIGVGDQLLVRIWEASPSGLFTSATGQTPHIDVVVDEQGMIFIPYVGRIRVAGRTIEAVRQDLQTRLEQTAVEPQVQVKVPQPRSHAAVVVGAVNKPGRYPISPAGTRVLDLVADAGGARTPTYETVLRLKRGEMTASVLLEHVFSAPQNNVPIKPGDDVLLQHTPRSFTAFGAVRSSGAVTFEAPQLTLAEALGRVGGLVDSQADAGGVFLFRFEERSLVEAMRPQLALSGQFERERQIPVVYRLSLKNARGFFHAQQFQMRDKDVIYVANSLAAELGKFVGLVGPLIGNANTVNNLTN